MSESGFPKEYWTLVFDTLRKEISSGDPPSVTAIARQKHDPFRVLISTMISLRTKDEVTFPASERLFAQADSPAALAALPEKQIGELIYPAGFYRTKATSIRTVAGIINKEHGGRVPDTVDKLVKLPGVGRKTANLVLNLGFDIPAICVDTHVHRISNRFGWISTKTPEKSEFALMEILPREHWIEINELLVKYGQNVCNPVSPWCSRCAFGPDAAGGGRAGRRSVPKCKRVGVDRSR